MFLAALHDGLRPQGLYILWVQGSLKGTCETVSLTFNRLLKNRYELNSLLLWSGFIHFFSV
jgi:hypothetical protein